MKLPLPEGIDDHLESPEYEPSIGFEESFTPPVDTFSSDDANTLRRVIGDACAGTPTVLSVTMPWELPGINLVLRIFASAHSHRSLSPDTSRSGMVTDKTTSDPASTYKMAPIPEEASNSCSESSSTDSSDTEQSSQEDELQGLYDPPHSNTRSLESTIQDVQTCQNASRAPSC